MIHIQLHPDGTQTLQDMVVVSKQTPQPLPGSTGDFTACQLHKPSSSLPYGGAGASAHGSKRSGEDVVKKRALRLMKNREAARECRRKKKEYVKCLENRVAVLENQNKTLIEELRALKDIYRHKIQ
ncbi:cAMP-responsive element modulator isoform X2 [Hippoglossus stenolepis]|uniref:cAMP-responsive element modulator isoform X2 n=1 Tax=Hippoglossus stenolepis TaxID=195615 RepID=UPI00159C5377|nr:cAMP-responsive element modulator isoform X2 [Hippoglossus stenolepis]